MNRARRRVFFFTKRAFDIVASAVGIAVLSPLILSLWILVALRLGRPVIFRQDRPGLRGQVFQMFKFRTMLEVDETQNRVSNEDRMTPFGSRLRSWSLDELPGLWNVLRGDMSLVGPRPLLVKYLPLYSVEESRRHDVRPGLTGLAQVNGRNALPWSERFALDVHYVDHCSWALDVRILSNTVLKVVRRDGITSTGNVVGAPFAGATRREQ